MKMRVSSMLAGILLAGCAAGSFRLESAGEKKLSELSDEQIRALCVHNVEAFRGKLPRASWGTQPCEMATITVLMSKPRESSVPFVERCKRMTAVCASALGSGENNMEPVEACQYVELDKARSCDAPVQVLQECLRERNDQMARVVADFTAGTICTAASPLKKASVMEGPACQKLLSICKESGLTLPRHVF